MMLGAVVLSVVEYNPKHIIIIDINENSLHGLELSKGFKYFN